VLDAEAAVEHHEIRRRSFRDHSPAALAAAATLMWKDTYLLDP
jgi:hypothetical protein